MTSGKHQSIDGIRSIPTKVRQFPHITVILVQNIFVTGGKCLTLVKIERISRVTFFMCVRQLRSDTLFLFLLICLLFVWVYAATWKSNQNRVEKNDLYAKSICSKGDMQKSKRILNSENVRKKYGYKGWLEIIYMWIFIHSLYTPCSTIFDFTTFSEKRYKL